MEEKVKSTRMICEGCDESWPSSCMTHDELYGWLCPRCIDSLEIKDGVKVKDEIDEVGEDDYEYEMSEEERSGIWYEEMWDDNKHPEYVIESVVFKAGDKEVAIDDVLSFQDDIESREDFFVESYDQRGPRDTMEPKNYLTWDNLDIAERQADCIEAFIFDAAEGELDDYVSSEVVEFCRFVVENQIKNVKVIISGHVKLHTVTGYNIDDRNKRWHRTGEDWSEIIDSGSFTADFASEYNVTMHYQLADTVEIEEN